MKALYLFVGLATFFADRITKWIASKCFISECVINPFLSFQLTINKGISWGMFHGSSPFVFWLMTLIIIFVTSLVGVHAYMRYKDGYSIFGETLILSGSCSNIVDRLLYQGVIDFIMVHKGELVWPLFNIADICIVLGVSIMAFQLLFKERYA